MAVQTDELTLERQPLAGHQIRAQTGRDNNAAADMMEQVLQHYGYTGKWRIRPLDRVKNSVPGRFSCSRQDPDGLRVKIRPAGQDTCWEYLVGCVNNNPIMLAQLKADIKTLDNTGAVPDHLRRTPGELHLLLMGVAEEQLPNFVPIRAPAKHERAKPTPAAAKRPPFETPKATAQIVETGVPLDPPPPPPPPLSIAEQILAQKLRIDEFKADMVKNDELVTERAMLVGQLEEAKKEVARIEAGIKVVDDAVVALGNKWPDAAKVHDEEYALQKLAQELKGLL